MAERVADQTRTSMTVAEFLQLPETNRIEHVLHGEYMVNPPPTDAHQRVVGNIHLCLAPLITEGKLRIAPTGVQLDDENFVEPDVFWVAPDDERCQLKEGKYWQGPPDLAVEVLSPGTARHDRVTKFTLYEQHGVREYWIVDPDLEYVEVWRLGDQQLAFLGSSGLGETFDSPVLGATVDGTKFFEG